MEATFKIDKNKFDSSFVEKIKSLFEKSDTIKITISDELDETDYLLSSEANAAVLAESLAQYKAGKFVTVSEEGLGK